MSHYQVVRRLPMIGGAGAAIASWSAACCEQVGVEAFAWDARRQRVELRYDASLVALEQLLELGVGHGLLPAADWRTRWKRSWYRFSDGNIRDNARYQARGCYAKQAGKRINRR